MGKKCEKCKYRNRFYFPSIVYYCDYLCMTGKRRPCEAGDTCTAYQEKEKDGTGKILYNVRENP